MLELNQKHPMLRKKKSDLCHARTSNYRCGLFCCFSCYMVKGNVKNLVLMICVSRCKMKKITVSTYNF